MVDLILLLAWLLVVVYVILGNYLYWLKILPTLTRNGLDGSPKFSPSGQLKQVDLFIAQLIPDVSRPWFYGLLAHVRAITAVVLAMLVAIVLVEFALQ